MGWAGCDLWRLKAGAFQLLLFLLGLSCVLGEALGLGREVMGRVKDVSREREGSGTALTSDTC